MASPVFFDRGHTPTVTDTRWFIQQRILGALVDIAGGGTGGAGIVGTDPDPNGIWVATPGTTYTDRLLKTFWMKETGNGNTGWLQYV